MWVTGVGHGIEGLFIFSAAMSDLKQERATMIFNEGTRVRTDQHCYHIVGKRIF